MALRSLSSGNLGLGSTMLRRDHHWRASVFNHTPSASVPSRPGLIQEDEHAGALSEKHTRALLLLRRNESQQLGLWERIKTEEMSGDEALRAADGLRQHAIEEPKDQLRTAIELVTLERRLRDELRRAQTADLLAVSEALEALRAELEEVETRGDV